MTLYDITQRPELCDPNVVVPGNWTVEMDDALKVRPPISLANPLILALRTLFHKHKITKKTCGWSGSMFSMHGKFYDLMKSKGATVALDLLTGPNRRYSEPGLMAYVFSGSFPEWEIDGIPKFQCEFTQNRSSTEPVALNAYRWVPPPPPPISPLPPSHTLSQSII